MRIIIIINNTYKTWTIYSWTFQNYFQFGRWIINRMFLHIIVLWQWYLCTYLTWVATHFKTQNVKVHQWMPLSLFLTGSPFISLHSPTPTPILKRHTYRWVSYTLLRKKPPCFQIRFLCPFFHRPSYSAQKRPPPSPLRAPLSDSYIHPPLSPHSHPKNARRPHMKASVRARFPIRLTRSCSPPRPKQTMPVFMSKPYHAI